MGGPEMARLITWGPRDGPQTPPTFGAPRRSRGAPLTPNVRSAWEPVALLYISLFRGQRFQRGGEAGEGGADHAGADLAHACAAAGDARVDGRRDRRLDHEPHVDADRTAAVVERRDAEVRVLAGADLAHLGGHGQRLGGAAGAQEARDGGRGGHGECAEADRLDDRAVAHVRVRVVGTEAGEVEASRHVDGRRKPALAAARDADPEI